MGTWSRNFLIPATDPKIIRDRFVNWMERRGFDLMVRPPLFNCEKDEERIAFLFSNTKWTVLIYNQAFPEGDRILTELAACPALLEVWIGDSDHWGYALYEKGEFSAGCTLNQEHATISPPPATINDAEKICGVLDLKDRLPEIKKSHRKWHIFADIPCERFCHAIGALPAILAAKDIEDWNAGRLNGHEVSGWKIEPLLFEKRKLLGHQPDEPVLHNLAVRSFSPRETQSPVDPEFIREMQRNMQIVSWIFRPIGCALAAPFIATMWLNKLGLKKNEKLKPGQEILHAIMGTKPGWHWDGSWLINERHGCRIRASKPCENRNGPFFHGGVFCFCAGEIEVSCSAVRSVTIRRIFDLRPDETVLVDEKFNIGSFPARILTKRTAAKDGDSYYYLWFVELPRAIYQFTVFQRAELPQNKANEITEVVKSLEIFSTIQTPSPCDLE